MTFRDGLLGLTFIPPVSFFANAGPNRLTGRDHIPIILSLQIKQLLYPLLVATSGIEDTPYKTIAKEVWGADSATGDQECCHSVCAVAEVTSQPVRHIQWQRFLHRIRPRCRTPRLSCRGRSET